MHQTAASQEAVSQKFIGAVESLCQQKQQLQLLLLMRAMQRFKTHPFPGPHLLHRKAGYPGALENDGDEDELAGRNESLPPTVSKSK